jgi:hypothetical protein
MAQCNRCHLLITEPREFVDAVRKVRRLPRGPQRMREWWKFKDTVCICPERGTQIKGYDRLVLTGK